jgi:hypothetical protein
MSRIDELLKLASLCYSQAHVTLNLSAKQVLIRMGGEYEREATELRSRLGRKLLDVNARATERRIDKS